MNKLLHKIRLNITYALPDRIHVRLMYLLIRHRVLHLNHPRSYSEKIQWLKVYGHLERYTSYVDKYAVREYVKATIGQNHLIPLIGVWDKFDDIKFDKLPDKFVIKASHGSGYNIIVTDKNAIDLTAIKGQLTTWINENYYYKSRESQYKYCQPKIIIEQLLEGDKGNLKDYKFYCFNGQPEIILLVNNRQTNITMDILDLKWQRVEAKIGLYPNSKQLPSKPADLDAMITMAKKLSKDFPFVRVDLYSSNNKLYFGELTFTPSSGLEKFGSSHFNQQIGKKINLTSYRHSLMS